MRGKIIKNISLFFIAMLFLSSLFSLFLNDLGSGLENYFRAKTVLAEDDEDDDEEDEEDDEDDDEDDEDDDFKETTTEVYSTQISNEVRRETVKNTFFDNDRDGIFDNEDKNPTINDFFIVKDDNRNGIVDEYEQ